MGQNFFAFVPLSLPKNIIETVTIFSSVSADHHVIVDTRAPRPIWSEDLLTEVNWHPFKKLPLTAKAPPFHFAVHTVCALYSV